MDPQTMSATAAALSALAAAISATTAFRSYLLARSIQKDAKSDEVIFVGKVSHPALRVRAHSDCVIQIPLFNKSKRKACVTALTVYDQMGRPIPVEWSDAIDDLGSVQNTGHLVGITDDKTLYVRRTSGQDLEYARILFAHTFSDSKEIVIFDPLGDFARGSD